MGKPKKELEYVPYGILARLQRLVPSFNIRTYNDVQLIDKLMKVVASGLQEFDKKWFEKINPYNLAEEELIDSLHPLYNELNKLYMGAQQEKSSIDKSALACISKKDLMQFVGAGLQYADIKLLEYWLIKD